MPETERRFLVDDPDAAIAQARRVLSISQSYVPGTGHWAVRLRTVTEDGVVTYLLTMKLPETAMTADEHETEVSPDFHAGLLPRCGPAVEKTRHETPEASGLKWEIDAFAADELRLMRRDGRIEPLILVEIELPDESACFERPTWIGAEVTDDKSFSNFQLARRIATVRSLIAGGMDEDEAITKNLLKEPE
jgi:adenylate cyclase